MCNFVLILAQFFASHIQFPGAGAPKHVSSALPGKRCGSHLIFFQNPGKTFGLSKYYAETKQPKLFKEIAAKINCSKIKYGF
jgi:hypothetical protein